MSPETLTLLAAFGFPLGLALGAYLEALKWRSKGDHEYMNTMASSGKLYTVKQQEPAND